MLYEPLQSGHIQLGDVHFGYSEWENNGPPLVMMHGITGNRHSYDCVLPYLNEHYRLFSVDHRGHGETSHHPGDSSVESMAGDIESFIERVVGEPALVWGHSMGGLVALKLAETCPSLVRAIVVEDPPLQPDDSRRDDTINVFQFWYDLTQADLSEEELFQRLLETDDSQDEEAHRYKAKNLKEMDASILEQALDVELWTEIDALQMVDNIQCPAFLLQADPDMGGLIGKDLATIPAFQNLNWSWKLCGGIGHGIHKTIPEETAKTVHAFFKANG